MITSQEDGRILRDQSIGTSMNRNKWGWHDALYRVFLPGSEGSQRANDQHALHFTARASQCEVSQRHSRFAGPWNRKIGTVRKTPNSGQILKLERLQFSYESCPSKLLSQFINVETGTRCSDCGLPGQSISCEGFQL
jgi:hypothetical protein